MLTNPNPGSLVHQSEDPTDPGVDSTLFRAGVPRQLLGSKLDARALYDAGEGYVLGFADGTTLSFGSFPRLAAGGTGLGSQELAAEFDRSPAIAIARYATGVLMATAEGAIIRVDVKSSALIARLEPSESCGTVVSLVASDSDGRGGWSLRSDGSVQNFGDAPWFGDLSGCALDDAATVICRTSMEGGYAVATSRGRVFRFGLGSGEITPQLPALNGSIVALVWSETADGYWLAASDGGVFSFGNAGFFGSRSRRAVTQNGASIAGMVELASGRGYWIAGVDGDVRAFGEAAFLGRALRSRHDALCIGIA